MFNNTAIVTSISPRNVDAQVRAVSSWQALSAPILSLNGAAEAEQLRNQLPFQIVSVEETATNLFGKPLIFIDSFLRWFLDTEFSHLIIVNSDIYLAEPARLEALAAQHPDELVFGRRVDVDSLKSTSGSLFDGFDYFILSRHSASLYPLSRFCMGAPWWDHWMPVVQLAKGRQVWMCEEPLVLHLKHEGQWGLNTQIPLAQHLSEHLLDLFTEAIKSRQQDPKENPLIGPAALFAQYFEMSRRFYSFHYQRINEYNPETQACLLHEICWRMPQIVLRYLFEVCPRVGNIVVGHQKDVPMAFR